MDPANADGMKFPGVAASDCSDLFVPQDLSTEKMAINLGAMDNCGAGGEGWQGTGASGDPYRFHLSGNDSNDRITVPTSDKQSIANNHTYSIWFKSDGIWGTDGSSSDDSCVLLHKASSSSSYRGFSVGIDPNTGQLAFHLKDASSQNSISGSTDILDNKWHHITIKFNRYSGTSYDIYLDGALEVTGTNNRYIDSGFAAHDLIIGDASDSYWEECQGDIGSVMHYERWLTSDEIKQNCNAQESRYTASDDICEDF